MYNTTIKLNNRYVLPHKSKVLASVSFKPVVKSILIYIIGIAFLRTTGLINHLDGLVASFIVSIVSSFPILRYIWLKTISLKMRTLLVSFWPIMILIYFLTTDITTGSGDGTVFFELTIRFSEGVFNQGKIWPGFAFFKSSSILYWFTIYFYSVPYYLFNNAYDAVFPFNSFITIIISQLLYFIVYRKSDNEYLSRLTFMTFLFFPGYWLHNLNAEREIVILLQLIVFVIVLDQFKTKHRILPLFLIFILFFTMLGSRSEYIIVYFFFISIYILDNKKYVKIKPLILYIFIIIAIILIPSTSVFTPSGSKTFVQIGLANTLNIFEKILTFPIRIFYSAVGAFPWTREGIVDAVGHDYIHYILHIISTIIRLVILVAFVDCLFSIYKGKNWIHLNDKIWFLMGVVLLLTIQFSSIGYTRYIDPAIVFLIPPLLIFIRKRFNQYFFGAVSLIIGAHLFYYIILI